MAFKCSFQLKPVFVSMKRGIKLPQAQASYPYCNHRSFGIHPILSAPPSPSPLSTGILIWMNFRANSEKKSKIPVYALEKEIFWGYHGEQGVGKEKPQLITPLPWGRKTPAPRMSSSRGTAPLLPSASSQEKLSYSPDQLTPKSETAQQGSAIGFVAALRMFQQTGLPHEY